MFPLRIYNIIMGQIKGNFTEIQNSFSSYGLTICLKKGMIYNLYSIEIITTKILRYFLWMIWLLGYMILVHIYTFEMEIIRRS